MLLLLKIVLEKEPELIEISVSVDLWKYTQRPFAKIFII